jgi:choline kinase/predicted kinase
MQGLILAAGYGKRLLPFTKDIPKTLLKIGDRTIIERLLDNFLYAGIMDVVIVVGYEKEKVISKIGYNYKGIKITYCFNEKYLVTNTMRSIWEARNAIKGAFIQCHGDLIFNPGLIKRVVSSPILDGIVINSDKSFYDSNRNRVKINALGEVIEINKDIPQEDAYGSSFGVYKFSEESAKLYYKIISELDLDSNEAFETPLRELINKIPFKPIDLKGFSLLQLDYPDDIMKAQTEINSPHYNESKSNSLKQPLVVLCGLMGTGKTTISNIICNSRNDYVKANTDDVRRLLGKKTFDPKDTPEVNEHIYFMIKYILDQGRGIVSDSANKTEEVRKKLYKIARDIGVPIIVVECVARNETAIKRIKERPERDGLHKPTNKEQDYYDYLKLWENTERDREKIENNDITFLRVDSDSNSLTVLKEGNSINEDVHNIIEIVRNGVKELS